MNKISSAAFVYILLLITFISPASTARADSVIRTVGASGCDYSEIQPAIDFMALQPPGRTKIIRIASDKLYNGTSLILQDVSVTLDGGYDACSSTSPGGNRAILRGNTLTPVIEISSSMAPPPRVEIRNLNISLGGGNLGGGISGAGVMEIVAHNLYLSSNDTSGSGGGIGLEGGASLTFSALTLFRNSADLNGGAIYCQDNGRVTGLGSNSFIDNRAFRFGGAIHIELCQMGLSGSHHFSSNSALAGGAIAGHGLMELMSELPGDIEIRNNSASETGSPRKGGGIALFGGSLVATDAIIEENWVSPGAGSCGGGVAVEAGIFHLVSSGNLNCDGEACARLRANKAELGAAGCTSVLGEIAIKKGRVDGHTNVDGSSASSTFRVDTGYLGIFDSFINQNSSSTLLDILDGGSLILAWSTVAMNIDIDKVVRVRTDGSSTIAQIFSSIVWQPGIDLLVSDASATLEAECVLASDISALPLHLYGDDNDPTFVDPANGDFHLQAGSPAIDFCNQLIVPVSLRDFDHGTRGIDDPQTSNNFPGALSDVGADEYGSSALVFADDFESGDLTAWGTI